MIRLALPNTTYTVPETGLPVEGRMKVFLHDSDEYATLYTLEGANYVQAENPQILHAGLPDSTLFTALGVFDVVIEKYIGTEGMLSVDSPDSDFEQVGDYEVGMDFDIASYSRNTVDTLEDLRDVNPELGMVTVKWYAEEGDCVPRTYVWDAECENTEDGGYIVGSDLSDSGKWVLMWDGDTLPATVYGVKPGSESNIALLLTYPAMVGSFQMATAPRVFFPAGTYTSNFSVYPTKGLVFDGGAKFQSGRFFNCSTVEVVGPRNSFLAVNITFPSGNSATAHSSWFQRLNAFFNCGAKILVVDETNWFLTKTFGATTVTGATIRGNTVFDITQNSSYITFDNCNIEATGIFDDKTRVKFQNMREFKEFWFVDQNPSKYNFVGNIASTSGGAIEFLPATNQPNIVGNVLDIADFTNPDIYLKALSAWMGTVALAPKKVDLEGRTVSSVPLCVATEYSNMTVLGDMYLPTTGTVTLRNVTCLGEVHGGGNCVCYNCTLNWRELPTTLNAYDSTVGAAVQVTGDFPLVCEGCDVHFNINNATDNTTARSQTIMRGCRLTQANGLLKTKNLYLENCVCENQVIEIYPYKDGGVYKTKFFASCCSFLSAYPVKVTKVHSVGGVEDTDCHHVKLDLTVTGNSFNGNDRGITVDYWGVKNTYKLFFAHIGNTVEYSGNSGKCPAEKPCGQWSSLSTVTSTIFYDEFAGTFTGYVCDKVFHVWPDFSDEGIVSSNVGWAYPDTFAYVIETMWSRGIFLDAIMSRLTSDNYGDACNFGYMNTSDPSATGALRVV